jgi:hypothetical protein
MVRTGNSFLVNKMDSKPPKPNRESEDDTDVIQAGRTLIALRVIHSSTPRQVFAWVVLILHDNLPWDSQPCGSPRGYACQ